MKSLLLLYALSASPNCYSQVKASNQKERLQQYIGSWVSTDKITDAAASGRPGIKMYVTPKMYGASLQVEVYQKNDTGYHLLLVELISYDAVTDQIVAAGQNNAGQCFTGKGCFTTDNQWLMKDRNHLGKVTLQVHFNFISSGAVVLKGTIPNAKGWEVKYVKVGVEQ
jgi:hypothetical protein